MPDNQFISDRIKIYRDSKGYSPKAFERLCGLSNAYLDKTGSVGTKILEKILISCPDLSREWAVSGKGEMLISELSPKEYESHIEVKLVTISARAGYSESYYSEQYLNDMPVVLIEADKEYKGNYLAFEVDGDSMEPEYCKGDIVICRELKRDLWQYKLHFNDWDFVIAHGTKGIMLKEIVSHDTESGEIVCHSLNHEEGRNQDFTLNLKEVAFLYNVVEHRRSGRNKRKNR